MATASDELLAEVRGRLGRGLGLALVFSLFLNLLQLAVPLFTMQIYDRVLNSRSTDTLFLLCLIAVGALIVYGVLSFIRARVYHVMGESFGRRLNLPTLQASIGETLAGDPNRAAMTSRDLNELRGFLTGTAISVPLDVLWTPLFLAVLYLMHPAYGLVAIASAVVLTVFGIANDLLSRPRLAEASAAGAAAFGEVNAAVRNAEAIEAMGMLPAVARRWEATQYKMLRLLDAGSRIAKAISAVSKSSRMAMQITVMSVGVLLVLEREASPGSIMAASILMGRTLLPFEQLIEGWRSWVFAHAAWQRVQTVLQSGAARRGTMAVPVAEGRVLVDRLVYVPKGSDRPVLRGVSFGIEPGEVLGIVGPSGSGKSTLARLIIGVLEPTSGNVYLDGNGVYQWERESFGRSVGYLPQSIQLLQGTIRDNIARMNEADPRDVLTAARKAGVHEMIGRLPFGYDTPTGEAGFGLSGGQRQRIALARALFGNPRLLVLDEPNSNLDTEGEQALLRAIEESRRAGTTVVLIAHRPSLMAVADKLVVLKDGAIERFGDRAEILRAITGAAPVSSAVPGASDTAKISRLIQTGDRR